MGMDAAHGHELRDQLIAALMTAEEIDFLEAQRIIMDFERAIVCPRCGAELTDRGENELSNTIWDGWMSRSA